jgi:hypothetical protein
VTDETRAMLEEMARDDIASGEVWPHDSLTNLVEYVMDLENLIRWFALAFTYQDQTGEWQRNDPIWTTYDERGNYLAESDRLQRTWHKVMDDA